MSGAGLRWNSGERGPLWIALAVLATLLVAELIAILVLNEGEFLFTLDDAYIHLAVAENFWHGHYGVNLSEPSSPSSSVIWPLLIAPFAPFSAASYFVLIMNTMIAVATLWVFWLMLRPDARTAPASPQDRILLAALLVAMILIANLVGLVFTGMEHSLQILLCASILYGLVLEDERRVLPPWLPWLIVLAPLVRYECLALSMPATVVLWLRAYRSVAIRVGIGIGITLGGFSVFLWAHGMSLLPTSVLAKSAVLPPNSLLGSLVEHAVSSYKHPTGRLLAMAMLVFVFIGSSTKWREAHRQLAWVLATGLLLHLLVGRYDWFGRYEVYIWVSAFLGLIYLFKPGFYSLNMSIPVGLGVLLIAGFTLVLAKEHLVILVTTPRGSQDVHEQQYQMHRFATEFWRKPVAINDLGQVAYRNDQYVLDLYGLASLSTLRDRQFRTPGWMAMAVARHDVQLAMLYDNWYRDIPASWRKLGDLVVGHDRVTAASSRVAFYAVDPTAYKTLRGRLEEFAATLPGEARFEFSDIDAGLVGGPDGDPILP